MDYAKKIIGDIIKINKFAYNRNSGVEGLMNKKVSIILVVLAIFLFNGLSLPFCSKNESTTPTASPTPTVTLNEYPLDTVDAKSYEATLTANYEKAQSAATSWNKDAHLVMVSVKLPADLSLNNSTETYTFGSSNELNYWFTYSLSESTGKTVRALVNKEDYLGATAKAIDKKYWRTNYMEAFQIAQNYGGTDFIKNNQDVSVNITLGNLEPKGWLWWLVEYKTPLGNSYSVRINPNDQTIVDESGTVITTGSTYNPATTSTETQTEPNIYTTATPTPITTATTY